MFGVSELQNLEWRDVARVYYEDDMERALEMALNAGLAARYDMLPFFRVLEGEALTRRVSGTYEIRDGLQVECREEGAQALAAEVDQICSDVAKRFLWRWESPALVTVLVGEADAPWHGARAGYMVDKYPYDKACIPEAAIQSSEHLRRAVAHEFAHVVVLNRTHNLAPKWVEEGIAQLAEDPSTELLRSRVDPEFPWESPKRLNEVFGVERRNGENQESIRAAYAQSALLAMHLFQLGGDAGINRFLAAFTHHRLLSALRFSLLDETPANHALHEAYGIGIDQLLADARAAFKV